jgi:fused signal recognition particle receptor
LPILKRCFARSRESCATILQAANAPVRQPASGRPQVILMVGVNGAGKTTTIGKLAKRLQEEGNSVILAAGDTFRAAAVEQLKAWGERNNGSAWWRSRAGRIRHP